MPPTVVSVDLAGLETLRANAEQMLASEIVVPLALDDLELTALVAKSGQEVIDKLLEGV